MILPKSSNVTLNVVGNYAQSEDLAQKTFVTTWKKLSELRESDKQASWLYGIARRIDTVNVFLSPVHKGL